jgi:predicted SnoaL-like aldol condensation-catalyzing enzyme
VHYVFVAKGYGVTSIYSFPEMIDEMLIFPMLQTKRLTLRKLEVDDLPSLVKYANNKNISNKYIQHNKDVADGFDHFYKLATASNRPLNYEEIVLLVGQGNFVATLCRANWNDGQLDQDYAQVDLFRIEDGKVVEHWDNVEPVPDHDVNSGKF